MNKNLNRLDRGIRIGIAALLTVGAWTAGFGSITAIILLILAAVMLATSVAGFCPIYALFGLSTKPRTEGN